MQYREVTFTFPDNATDRDKIITVLQSPYSLVRWCRTQMGYAPNIDHPCEAGCVIEEYIYRTTDVPVQAGLYTFGLPPNVQGKVIIPTWVQRVISYVDREHVNATYNDVANMLMTLIQKGEIA